MKNSLGLLFDETVLSTEYQLYKDIISRMLFLKKIPYYDYQFLVELTNERIISVRRLIFKRNYIPYL